MFVVNENGPYEPVGDTGMTGRMVSLLYQPPAMRWRGVSVLTNTPPRRAQSQPGGMQGITLMEPILAKAARKLGVDQVAIHRDQRAGRQGEVRSGEPARRARVRDERVRQGGARSRRRAVPVGRAQGAGRQAPGLEGARLRRRDERLRRRVDRLRRPVRDQARRPHVHPVRHRQSRHRVDERLPSRRRPRWSACRGRKSSSPGATPARICRGAASSGGSQTTHAQTRAAHAAGDRRDQEAAGDRREGSRRQAGGVHGRQRARVRARRQHDAGAGGAEGDRARRQVRRPRAAEEHQRVHEGVGDGARRPGADGRGARHLPARRRSRIPSSPASPRSKSTSRPASTTSSTTWRSPTSAR